MVLAQPDLQFWLAALAIMVLGMAAGVEYDLMAYLVSRYFGLRHYAAIYGALPILFLGKYRDRIMEVSPRRPREP